MIHHYKLTFTIEHSLQARSPRRSLGIDSKDMVEIFNPLSLYRLEPRLQDYRPDCAVKHKEG